MSMDEKTEKFLKFVEEILEVRLTQWQVQQISACIPRNGDSSITHAVIVSGDVSTRELPNGTIMMVNNG